MGKFFRRLFDSDFMPHGHCFFWQPSVLWTHVISDALIASAYFALAVILYYFFRKRPDLKLRGLLLVFASFILACGATHLMAVWDIWHSTYRLEGLLKAITAGISVTAAIVSIRVLPFARHIVSPQQLEKINESLRAEIAARKQMEERLQEHLQAEIMASEDKLRSCFEAASQAILGVTSKGDISLVNRRTEEMFGYVREELLGQPLAILLPERFRKSHAAHRESYFAEPRVRTMGTGMEFAGLRKDGKEFPVEIGLSHVQTPDGPLAFGMVSDISERKNAADALRRVNEELRRSNVEIEQFAHVASHDLQEPLRMVTNYLQLIERRYDSLLDDDGREFIGFAVDGAKRMKALITDLLDFSRAGTEIANVRKVPVINVVEDALANLKTAIDESGARITVDPLPSLEVDAVLLTQVFQNLIANAIKFQKGTTPSVHISADNSGGTWIFSVTDNGIGIEPHHIDRIFRIFERLHGTEEYAGSGIGLAITRKIVERHGGRIWVKSALGAGSTFYFSLSAEMEKADYAKIGSL